MSRFRSKFKKPSMPSLMMLISLLVSCSAFGDSTADIVARKATASLRHWEYSDPEFKQLIRLTEKQREFLVTLLDAGEVTDDSRVWGLMVLAILNCVQVEYDSSVRSLYGYLCRDENYERFVERAVQSFDSIYLLSFAKASDRNHTVDFLRSYIDLLKAKAFVSGEDLEYLEEIYTGVQSRRTGP